MNQEETKLQKREVVALVIITRVRKVKVKLKHIGFSQIARIYWEVIV